MTGLSSWARSTLLVGMLVIAVVASVASLPGTARAAGTAYPPLTGNITGPSVVGVNLSGKYVVSAAGGPATGANSSHNGFFSYTASVTSGNVSGATISPISGVLTNGSVTLTLSAPNITESLVFTVNVTSTLENVTNESIPLSMSVGIVTPYRLAVTLYSTTDSTLESFNLTVMLDGTPVGQIRVPTIAGHASYLATFNYVSAGLSTGTHTFTVSLTTQHGLIVFANGLEAYSVSFYVTGSTPDYTLYYVAGGVALVGAIFIWLTFVAARRRGRGRK